MTLFVVVFASYLLFTELSKALTGEIRSEMVFSNLQVFPAQQITEIPVQLDLDLLNAPCDLVDIRALTTRTSAFVLQKYHLYADNRTEEFQDTMGNLRSIEEMTQSLGQGVGCKVRGSFSLLLFSEQFIVQIVPSPVLDLLRAKPGVRLDYSHRINSLLVGEASSHAYYER